MQTMEEVTRVAMVRDITEIKLFEFVSKSLRRKRKKMKKIQNFISLKFFEFFLPKLINHLKIVDVVRMVQYISRNN